MLYKLEPARRHYALPLVEDLDHLLLLEAVIADAAPGYVLVDDPRHPTALFASGPEGHYVLGNPDNESFNAALEKHINQEALPMGRRNGWAVFMLYYEPGWEHVVESIWPDQVLVRNSQRFFQYQGPAPLWHDKLPPNATIIPIDAPLLSRADLANIEHLRDFCSGDYRSVEDFLERGFGTCLILGDIIAAWCTTDCVVGDRAEVGIATVPAQRRKGYGMLVAAATVDMALERGISTIGWHCWQQNLASAATALKVGFVEQYSHAAVDLWLNPIDGHLVNGNLALMSEDYATATEQYKRAFHLFESGGHDLPVLMANRAAQATYRYHAACAAALSGDTGTSRAQLERALSYGSFRQGGA